MRRMLVLAFAFLFSTGPAFAQEYRFSANNLRGYTGQTEDLPNVQMRRRADNLVVSVRVACDTRDAAQRRREINETLRTVLRAAENDPSIELSLDDAGNVIPFTENALATLEFYADDGRPDTSAVTLVIKTPVSEGDTLQASSDRIRTFIERAPREGRSEYRILNDWEPTVVSPDQYRPAILAMIAEDARATAAAFGPQYGVQVQGLSRQVTWRQSGPLELMLYIPYQLGVTPAS